MQYPILVERVDDEYLISSRDVPELNAIADTYEAALSEALDAFETALMIYMDDRQAIPSPSALQEGEEMLYLPVRVSAKVALYTEMLEQKVSKANLAKRLNCSQKQIDRLWDLSHSTKLEAIEKAFLILGKRMDICFA